MCFALWNAPEGADRRAEVRAAGYEVAFVAPYQTGSARGCEYDFGPLEFHAVLVRGGGVWANEPARMRGKVRTPGFENAVVMGDGSLRPRDPRDRRPLDDMDGGPYG